jgi:hypothetical protein
MTQLIAALERLGTEIEQMAYAADRKGRDARRRRHISFRARRPSLVIALVLLLLVAAAAAIAATSGWLTGEPVKERPGMTFKSDVGLGKVIAGSARLAALRVPDPAGGPPWGIRTLHTTRQLGCVQVGRVVDGKLGVLGRDGAFGNDDKFHELPPSVLSQSQCAPLDGAGHAFIAISYSGMPAGGLRDGCAARPFPKQLLRGSGPPKQPRGGHPLPLCPRSDLRNVLYGTLGPQGKAITYRDPTTGRAATQAAVGPDHAYLVVSRPTAEHPGTGSWYTLQTPGSGLTAVHYRDGNTCPVASARRAGGARPCPAKGLVIAPLTGAQVHAPISVTAAAKVERPLTGPPGDRRPGMAARRVTVGFRAPIATPDARSYYVVSFMLGRAAAHRCGFAGMSGPVARSVRAGEAIRQDFWIRPSCHDAIEATVALHRQGKQPDVDIYAGGRTPADDAIVGRATLKLP